MTKAAETRAPAVAGRFYPRNDNELSREVETLMPADEPTQPAVAALVPHAAFEYSGRVAGHVFSRIDIPPLVVIMCPNHTGFGPDVSVMTDGHYDIPGGSVPVDRVVAHRIISHFRGAVPDTSAHRYEHGIEVELPFLLARQPSLRIVPLVLGHLTVEDALRLGRALDAAIGDHPALVVASTDMSHYHHDREARRLDHVAIDSIRSGSATALYWTVRDNRISMCGYIPATVMLAYSKLRNGGTPELVSYATTADASGERDRVVGYAGMVVPAAA